ncbi:MAG: tail fiber domain-containing protein [Bacteroidota bacterium]
MKNQLKQIVVLIFFMMSVTKIVNSQTSGTTGRWDLNGNSGTSPGTNYLGTSDTKDLVFKTKATQRMRMSSNTSSVLIGTGSAFNSSSLLELNSTSKGILIPRMTEINRDAISSPATGLLIYQTDNTHGFYHYTGSEWTGDWQVGGNSWSAATPNYKYFGTTDCHSVFVEVKGTTVMGFYPNCLTSSFEYEIRYLDGGVIGTGTKMLYYDWTSPSLLLPQSDRVHLVEPDTASTTKGFVYRAPGTSSTAAFSSIVTDTGAITRTALLGYSVPQSGYGTGSKGEGGGTGIYGKGSGGTYAGTVYGINGYALGKPGIGTRVGVFGKADTARVAIGVYGSASQGSDTTRAGYFSGILEHTGIKIGPPSDEKLKENIIPFSGAIEKLKKLSVKSYSYKPEFSFMHLPEGTQIGLMAQELERVFPEMVVGSVHPAGYDPETREKISDEVHYKSLNYEGLIPVLIEGMNEQQQQIEESKKLKDDIIQLKTENAELKNQLIEIQNTLARIENKSSKKQEYKLATLEQNNPNPFSEKTFIRYFIPSASDQSVINIYSSEKALLKSYPVTSVGDGEIIINAGSFSAGNYFYELVIDNKIIESKKMVLTK